MNNLDEFRPPDVGHDTVLAVVKSVSFKPKADHIKRLRELEKPFKKLSARLAESGRDAIHARLAEQQKVFAEYVKDDNAPPPVALNRSQMDERITAERRGLKEELRKLSADIGVVAGEIFDDFARVVLPKIEAIEETHRKWSELYHLPPSRCYVADCLRSALTVVGASIARDPSRLMIAGPQDQLAWLNL